MGMQPSDYATLAWRYWRTYLPGQLARLPEADREAFFSGLGQEVADRVEELTEENLTASLRPDDGPQARAERGLMAMLRAREQALEELVYLPKEPGTEDREMPRGRHEAR
jgi:hypothetical protein